MKKCVAAKEAKLSSWLLPQSGYKWVEVIQYLQTTSIMFRNYWWEEYIKQMTPESTNYNKFLA